MFLHLDKNNILAKEQFGFRPHASTEQASYTMINGILSALYDNLIVGGMFCDLQKAFDCVNHKTVMGKLEFYGIQGKFKTLIKSYLTERFQKVTLGIAESEREGTRAETRIGLSAKRTSPFKSAGGSVQ